MKWQQRDTSPLASIDSPRPNHTADTDHGDVTWFHDGMQQLVWLLIQLVDVMPSIAASLQTRHIHILFPIQLYSSLLSMVT